MPKAPKTRPTKVSESPMPLQRFKGFFQTSKNRCLQACINNLVGKRLLPNKILPDPTKDRCHPNFADFKLEGGGFVIDDIVHILHQKGFYLHKLDWKSRGLCKFKNPKITGKYVASGIHNEEAHAIGIDADRRLVFSGEVWDLNNPSVIHNVMNSGICVWHKLVPK
jgi:hypothetical protein